MATNNTATYIPENLVAGGFPIAKDSGKIKSGATIRKHAPVVIGTTGIEEATADTIANVVGIAADIPSGDEVVYYVTGEFNSDAITFPTGVKIDTLKPVCRKLGIFLR